MTDPFGLMKFAECEHQQLKCEKCGARSDIRGWQTFTGKDKDMLELRDEIDRLTARLAAAEARYQPESLHAEVTAWRNERDEIKARLAAAEAKHKRLDDSLEDEVKTNVRLTTDNARLRGLLREACIGYEHNFDDASSDKRLRRVPIFHAWYERAQAALGGKP